jgi:hypothetical protein
MGKTWVVAGVFVLAATGFGLWWYAFEPTAPRLNRDLEQRLEPVVYAYLQEQPATGGSLPAGRWFCAGDVFESQYPDQPLLGIRVLCQEYERRGDALVTGTATSGPRLVRLQDGRVMEHSLPPDGAGYSTWLDRALTAGGRAALRRLESRPAPDTDAAARQAFGLPPDAPVRHPTG